MKIEKLMYSDYIHGRKFPANTIILKARNGIEIICQDFNLYNGKLHVCTYKHGKWNYYAMRNEFSKAIYSCYCKGKHKAITVDCAKLMKHDRVHKKGGGGKISPTYIVTDYECTKNPLHDFRRSMYVPYN